LLLYALMRRHLGGLESRRMLAMLAKVAVAAGALAAVCAASSHWLLADWATQTLLSKVGALLATVIVGALVFAGCGAALHIDELKELQGAIKRRLRRTA
jgi:peptidoglycan biosynthesis protein MviN/MurJ (putative lipid II flippase)